MKSREDWLCEVLDTDYLSDDLRLKYEKELDAIADQRSAAGIKAKEVKIKEAERVALVKALILTGNADLIATFGKEEFGEDYEILQEGELFVVYSKVAKDSQQSRRPHVSIVEAEADLRYLLYNRLYDKYVRADELDNLSSLTK
jgi:hypothetical protein